jgi:hypothetical protein
MRSNLPELPSAIVTFLLDDCKYSDEVVAGCVLELVGEGVLLSVPGPDGALTVSLGGASPPRGRRLLAFEKVVLDRVRRRDAGPAGVPLPVLLSDDGDDYRQWRKRLTGALGREGKKAGLAMRRASNDQWWVMLVLTIIFGGGGLLAYFSFGKAGQGFANFGGLAVLLCLISVLVPHDWRLTSKGAAFADQWRGQGGGPADTPAPSALVAESAPGNVQLPPGQVWSSFGGQWHPIEVGPPQPPALQWCTPRTLVKLLLATAVAILATNYAAIANAAARSLGLPAHVKTSPYAITIMIILATLGAAVIFVFWLPAYVRRLSLPGRVSFTAQVVKRWQVDQEYGPTLHYVCVDNGSPSAGMTVRVDPALYKRLSVGDAVRVAYSPRWQRLYHIRTAGRRPTA